jgi:hypothetical protein
MASGMDGLLQRWDALAPAPRRVLLLLIVAIVLGGTAPYFEALLDANERPRLLAGIALIEEGSVRVDGPWATGLALGPDLARADDGSLVPNKPPGATVVAALTWFGLRTVASVFAFEPTLRAYTILARILGALLPTLILAAWLWRHERVWAASRAQGPGITAAAARARVDFAVLAWMLATPAWANAKLLFGHSLAACLLGVGVLALIGKPGVRVSAKAAALGGMLAGSAVLVEYTAVFAGPALAIWMLWRERGRWRVILAALGGALIPIAILAGYHDAVFGSPWLTPYHRAVDEGFAAVHARGLLGLQLPTTTSLFEHLLSPWGGLLVWAPLCLFGIFGSLHAVRTSHEQGERSRQLLCACVSGSLLLVLIGLEQGGGWRVGPRYFVIAMPLTVPGLVAAVRELGRPGRGLGMALLLGLAGAALLGNFLAANWFPHLLPHGNPLGDLLWPLVVRGHAAHGVSPWFVACLALALWAGVLVRLRLTTGVHWSAWLGGLLLATGLSWFQAVGPVSDPAADYELEVIERIWEGQGAAPPSHPLRW